MVLINARFAQFLEDDSGATAIEYGLIAAFMGVGMILTFVLFGESLAGIFGFVRDNAGNAIDSAG